jgi:hypothetical protein
MQKKNIIQTYKQKFTTILMNPFGYTLVMVILFLLNYGSLWGVDFFTIRENIIHKTWKKIGMFYLSPSFTLSDTGYSSNIFSYQEMEEPDWTADAGIGLKVSSFLGNRFIISIDENPYYSFYSTNKDQEAFNNRFKLALYTYIGRFNFKYQYLNDHIKSRPSTEFGARVRTNTRAHTLSSEYGNYQHFFINVYVGQSAMTYDEEEYLDSYNLKDLMNRQQLRAGIKLNKTIFTQTHLILNYEFFQYTFNNHSERDGLGHLLSLGIQFPEIGILKGSLTFGIKAFNPGNSLYKDFTKPFGSGKVSITLLKRIKLHVNYLADNFYSFWNADQNYFENAIGMGVEFYLTKSLKLGYNYRSGRLTYENLLEGNQTRQDDFRMSTFTLGIKIFKNVGIGIDCRIYRTESSEIDFIRNFEFIGGHIIHEF